MKYFYVCMVNESEGKIMEAPSFLQAGALFAEVYLKDGKVKVFDYQTSQTDYLNVSWSTQGYAETGFYNSVPSQERLTHDDVPPCPKTDKTNK